jgi:hypothetical protein
MTTERATRASHLSLGHRQETHSERLGMVLDRTCDRFLELVAAGSSLTKTSPATQHILVNPTGKAPCDCDVAALRIATQMLNFSLVASAEIQYSATSKATLPAIELTPACETDKQLDPGLIIDKTRRFTRALLHMMDREQLSSSWTLRVDYPQTGAHYSEALFAARITAGILESDFGHEELHAQTNETQWQKGGHLLITVERAQSLTSPQRKVAA